MNPSAPVPDVDTEELRRLANWLMRFGVSDSAMVRTAADRIEADAAELASLGSSLAAVTKEAERLAWRLSVRVGHRVETPDGHPGTVTEVYDGCVHVDTDEASPFVRFYLTDLFPADAGALAPAPLTPDTEDEAR